MKPILTFSQTRNTNRLLTALRSGKYTQIHCQFRDRKGGFCILGLGLHLVNQEGFFHPDNFETHYGFEMVFDHELSRNVSLMFLNDNRRRSFTQMADLIEHTYNTNIFLSILYIPIRTVKYLRNKLKN